MVEMTDSIDEIGLLTEQDLCKQLGISAVTAQRMRYEGWGPRFVVLGPRRVAYRPSAISEWLTAREVQQGVAHQVNTSVVAKEGVVRGSDADCGKPKPNIDLSKWDDLAREFIQKAFEKMEKHQPEFNEELMCILVKSEVDFELHQTVLFFPEMNCCDMRGAINFAKRTDPKVKRIVTIAGENLDTVYYYDDDEEEPGWYVNRSFEGKGRQWQR
jgi:predicted DNA-binding transcriptional regulator AlpA